MSKIIIFAIGVAIGTWLPSFSANAQIISEFISKKPLDIEWCDSKLVQRDCYDGISYAYLLEKGVSLSEYPKTEEEFYTLQASYVEVAI